MAQRFEDTRIGQPYQGEISVLNTIFYDEEKGFGIYSVRNDEDEQFAAASNWMSELISGARYKVDGLVAWSKYGNQLKCLRLEPLAPKGKKGTIAYLESLPGISTKRADTLYQRFGAQILTLLKEDPARVAKATKGIGIKTLKGASEALIQQEADQALYVQLYEWGLSQEMCRKLKDRFGETLIQKLESNPYFLMGEVRGFGFLKCDKIALRMGISVLHPQRLEQGLMYTLKQGESSGHCYLNESQLYEQGKALLSRPGQPVPVERLEAALNRLLEEESLVRRDDAIYLKETYFHESFVALKLNLIDQKTPRFGDVKIQAELDEILTASNITLEVKQNQACVEFNRCTNGVYVLDGSAGTGKSFTLQLILKLAKALKKGKDLKVLLMAPTGKASKVITLSTGMDAMTVHRGLMYNPGEQLFTYNAENLLDIDVVVVDESSMLDIHLMYHLCSAIPIHAKFILMGDTKQLPSVGCGNVLKDLIESGVFTVITLDVIRRQDLTSDIVRVADDIIAGGPLIQYHNTNDAFFMYQSNPFKTQDLILRSVARLLERPDYDLDEIQVLSCQAPGSLGTLALNYLMQQRFNPVVGDLEVLAQTFNLTDANGETKEVKLHFKVGDKVIHTQNRMDMVHYDKLGPQQYDENKHFLGLINGDCGRIDDIYETRLDGRLTTVMVVRYDSTYVLYKGDFSELKHAYCLTIHKSQGSAWRAVITAIGSGHKNMLENNLIYTAWTRSRTFSCLIGCQQAIFKGLKTFNAPKRQTHLKQLLIDADKIAS